MPVIKDDTVTITKGDRKLTEGKVIRVDTKEGRVYIEGVTRTRLDGSTVQIPIRTENVMITKLKMDDDMRKRMLERRAFSFKKES
jgi:ribosomal protein uL24